MMSSAEILFWIYVVSSAVIILWISVVSVYSNHNRGIRDWYIQCIVYSTDICFIYPVHRDICNVQRL